MISTAKGGRWGAILFLLAVWMCVAEVESFRSWLFPHGSMTARAFACSTKRYTSLLIAYKKRDSRCAQNLFTMCCDVCPGTEKECWQDCFANLPRRVQWGHVTRCRRARRRREERRKIYRLQRKERARTRWQRKRRWEEAVKADVVRQQEEELLSAELATQEASEKMYDMGEAHDQATSGDLEFARNGVFDRVAFDQFADKGDIPGALRVKQLKYLVANVQTDPQLYFMNAQRNETYHFDFARDNLNEKMSLAEFNQNIYNNEKRLYLSGSVVAHDQFVQPDGRRGIYTMEFWSGDIVPMWIIVRAYKMLLARLPFASSLLKYYPSGDGQREALERYQEINGELGVPIVTREELYGNQSFSPLNLGVGFGKLRVLGPEDTSPSTVRDVVICTIIPNDISHVAGVITEQPQTPLSHVNLKAKQNKSPNAFLKDASKLPHIAPLIGKFVRYEVTPEGVQIRAASEEEVKKNLEALRPATGQTPPRNLTVVKITSLDNMGHADASAFGAKAANVAELRRLLGHDMIPSGFAVPFAFYDRFMKFNGLYAAAKEMAAKAEFKNSSTVREKALKKFRKRFKKLPLPADMMEALAQTQAAFPENQPIRCRSSTNNEDLENFNGAGLYDSSTHRKDEGHLANTIKKVWRSLWNFRAFEEREFYKIDHAAAAMGVLLHRNFDNELSNGVAVTKHIYNPSFPGYYVNVQVGEALVTNPDGGAIPDEFVITDMYPDPYVVQTIRRSNLNGGKPVMQKQNLDKLVNAMAYIQYHFLKVYGRDVQDTSFAMDIEFKEDAKGKLVIKQARPWVD